MKTIVVQLSLLVSALLAHTTSADGSTHRDDVLDKWAQSDSTTRSRRPQMRGPDDTTRLENVPVDGTISILQVVPGTEDTRRSRRAQEAKNDVVPYPPDGETLAKTGVAIHFKEDVSSTDVDCFVFTHDSHSFSACSKDFDIDVEGGVADIQLTGFQLGTYTWWVEDSTGAKSSPQSFTIESPQNMDRGEVVRRSAGVEEIVGEAEWEYGGDILGATGRRSGRRSSVESANSFACLKALTHLN